MATLPGLYLLRHGEVDGEPGFRGSSDVPLSETGWQQMAAATAAMPWQHVITSPLQRCHAFAARLAHERGISLQTDARLQEICFGEWEGRHPARLMQEDGERLTRFWQNPWEHSPPGGEDLAVFQARVLDAWQELQAAALAGNTLVVTHGGVIRILLMHCRALPRDQLLNLDVDYASLHAMTP